MLSVLAAVAGCTKWIKPDSEEDTLSKHFKHTGCSHDTRGIYTDDPSLLSLKYENGDLRVTRTNAELNCSFKDLGLTCEAYLEGNIIHYDVVCERAGYGEANCVCLVEKNTSSNTALSASVSSPSPLPSTGICIRSMMSSPCITTLQNNL